MEFVKIITNSYDRKARLYPALILIFPAIIPIYYVSIAHFEKMQIIINLIIACGFPFLLTQFTRDNGKKIENTLFNKWGGMPSMVFFRHRDSKIDPLTKNKYHKKLANLVQNTKLFTLDEEIANKDEADNTYIAWSNYIRTHTRDTNKFKLLYYENINYGFRRNLVGSRKFGLIISIISIVTLYLQKFYTLNLSNIEYITILYMVIECTILLLWLFYFTDNWVRIPAEAYALRLAESIDLLCSDANSQS
jgi:hypothetical protein